MNFDLTKSYNVAASLINANTTKCNANVSNLPLDIPMESRLTLAANLQAMHARNAAKELPPRGMCQSRNGMPPDTFSIGSLFAKQIYV